MCLISWQRRNMEGEHIGDKINGLMDTLVTSNHQNNTILIFHLIFPHWKDYINCLWKLPRQFDHLNNLDTQETEKDSGIFNI